MIARARFADPPGELGGLWFWWDLVRARTAAALHRLADGPAYGASQG